jgi:hypothetical protein
MSHADVKSFSRRDDAEVLPTVGGTSPADRGRLGVYTAIGASVSAIPLPWVPDSLARRVRGALVHDIAVRHGLSLSREGREVLCEPGGAEGPRRLLEQTVRFVVLRVAARALTGIGPVSLVWPARSALQTFALGHLFDRYLGLGRVERAVRIDATEARRVRQAVDAALHRALTVDVPPAQAQTVVDDQRDAATAFVDDLLGLAASLPGRLVARLEAAFDERIAHADG